MRISLTIENLSVSKDNEYILAYFRFQNFKRWFPKCKLPELKTRPNTGPVLAAKSRPMLLGQYQRSNRPNVVSVLAPYIGISNLPSFRRSLSPKWHSTGPRVGIIPANHVGSRKARVQPLDIISAMAQYWRQVSATSLPVLGQRWAVCDFALGLASIAVLH